MFLETVGKVNALSEKLRSELQDKVLSFGESVRYQFEISRTNPDPDKRSGPVIWPHLYTLQPRTFNIVDPYVPKGHQNMIKVGLIKKMDEEGKKVELWDKIQVEGKNRGMFEVDLRKPEGVALAMFMEMHPKNKTDFFKVSGHKVFYRIDEDSLAKEKRAGRSLRKKAMDLAETMSEADDRLFADAMSWTETNMNVIRNMIEDMAENESQFFLDMYGDGSKQVEYQAAVQRAKDKRKILYDNVNHRFTWENGKVITMLAPESTNTDVEQLAAWLQTGGEQAEQAYKKIQSLIK